MSASRTRLLLWTMLGVAAACASAEAANCKLAEAASWPVRLERNRLLVEGAINGQKVSVMLDTGATRTLIFRTAAVRLGLPMTSTTNERMFGVGGETKVDVAQVDEFRVGEAAQKELRMLVAGEQNPGDEVGVLLGEDFFRVFDVEFDLVHNAVRLFQPKDCDSASLAYWARDGASVVEFERLDVNRPEIILTVRINDQPLPAMLDSGASRSVIDKAEAERVGVTPQTPGVVVAGRGTGLGKNAVDSWFGPFKSFAIGGETIRDTQILFSDLFKDATYHATGSNIARRIQVSHSMLLGADFLRSHRVLVAHSQRKLYFTYAGGPVFQPNQGRAPSDPTPAGSAQPDTGKD
jgi:clan AA aspartic protease (TIGR02281 family)